MAMFLPPEALVRRLLTQLGGFTRNLPVVPGLPTQLNTNMFDLFVVLELLTQPCVEVVDLLAILGLLTQLRLNILDLPIMPLRGALGKKPRERLFRLGSMFTVFLLDFQEIHPNTRRSYRVTFVYGLGHTVYTLLQRLVCQTRWP